MEDNFELSFAAYITINSVYEILKGTVHIELKCYIWN